MAQNTFSQKNLCVCFAKSKKNLKTGLWTNIVKLINVKTLN